MRDTDVTVVGAGSWGTALAIQLARAGCTVTLCGRDSTLLDAMRIARVNERYLPGAIFPEGLAASRELHSAIGQSGTVLVSVPSHAFRAVLAEIGSSLTSDTLLTWATKGLELDTGLLPHQVVSEVLPQLQRAAVVSGPTFAIEVGKGLPTALTVAAVEQDVADSVATLMRSESFRVYTSTDMVGVETGGAVKNVLAIGAGLSDGLGFGANARVALITRGLREMMRLGLSMGASSDTFMGLAGMGDLVLTCTDNQSRNRRMGLALASGQGLAEAEQDIGQVVEGVGAARAVQRQATRLNIEMPIVEQIYRVIHEGLDPQKAVRALLQRTPGRELGG